MNYPPKKKANFIECKLYLNKSDLTVKKMLSLETKPKLGGGTSEIGFLTLGYSSIKLKCQHTPNTLLGVNVERTK